MNKIPSRYVAKATEQLLKLCPFWETAVCHMTNFTQDNMKKKSRNLK